MSGGLITNRKYTKHKITNSNTNKLALVKTQRLSAKTVHL